MHLSIVIMYPLLSRLSTTITELTTLQVQLDTERESKDETLKQLEQLRSSTDYIINMEEQTTPTNNESMYEY